jgi:hypothetical protein
MQFITKGMAVGRRLSFTTRRFTRPVLEIAASPAYGTSFQNLFSRFRTTVIANRSLLVYPIRTPSNIHFFSRHAAPFIFSLCGFLFVQTNKLYSSVRQNNS